MIVSVIGAKGGTGKTTSAVFLATYYARRGHKVTLIDLDPQGSATDWADRAEDAEDLLPFEVEVGNAKRLERVARRARGRRGELVVLDTPPGSPQVIDAAIEASDFVVVPTRHTGADAARVWEALPSLEGKDYAVLITSARLGTRSLEAFISVLDEQQVPRFRSVIPLRESVADAYGTTPTKFEGYENVAQEIQEALNVR